MAVRRCLVVVVLALVASAFGPGPARSQESTTLAFEDATTGVLDLSGKEVVHVSIRNRSDAAQVVSANLRLEDASRVSVSDAFTVLVPTAAIPATQLGTVRSPDGQGPIG